MQPLVANDDGRLFLYFWCAVLLRVGLDVPISNSSNKEVSEYELLWNLHPAL